MLRAISNVARFRPRSVAVTRDALPSQAYALNTRHLQWRRPYTNSPTLSETKYVLSTLNPSNPSSEAQGVLDVSGESEVVLSCKGRTDALVRIWYNSNLKFPPNTRGVLYYDPAKRHRHIRFRLCDNVADFSRGSDLLETNGERWTLSLEKMTWRLGQYRPLLNMIKEEHPSSAIDVAGNLSTQRIITTLAPQDLVAKGQRVFDISHLRRINPHFSTPTSVKAAHIHYYGRDFSSFPANTRGVFYYKQSTSAPNTIGELRFRLCSDVASFDMGRDLCLPSGVPWCIASDHLLSISAYSAIREQLLHEGFFKEPLRPYTDGSSIPVISSLNQPFAVDLSYSQSSLRFKIGAEIGKEISLYLFGRAVVQLERYPSEYLRGRDLKRNPLFALRFLEFLTPVEAKPDKGLSPLKAPEVGQLLTRKNQGGFMPWGYSPYGATIYEQLLKLTEQPPTSE